MPLTGKYAFYGEYYIRGLNLAVEQINEEVGAGDRKIEIIYEDNQGDTLQSINAYQKLSTDHGVKIYITTFSGVTLALAPLTEQNKHILFNLNSAASTISQAGDYVFRNNIYPKLEIEKMVSFLKGRDYNEIGVLMFRKISCKF